MINSQNTVAVFSPRMGPFLGLNTSAMVFDLFLNYKSLFAINAIYCPAFVHRGTDRLWLGAGATERMDSRQIDETRPKGVEHFWTTSTRP